MTEKQKLLIDLPEDLIKLLDEHSRTARVRRARLITRALYDFLCEANDDKIVVPVVTVLDGMACQQCEEPIPAGDIAGYIGWPGRVGVVGPYCDACMSAGKETNPKDAS
jgi:hypothetical protein